MPCGQQLFEHHGDFDAIGRGERIKLKRMFADRQLFVVGGPGNGAVDAGKTSAAFCVPGPNLGRCVFGAVGHVFSSFGSAARLAPSVTMQGSRIVPRHKWHGQIALAAAICAIVPNQRRATDETAVYSM